MDFFRDHLLSIITYTPLVGALVLLLPVFGIVAAAIEQNHDDHGICWPEPLAPFQVAILPMNAKKSHRVREAAEKLSYGGFHALPVVDSGPWGFVGPAPAR